MNATQLSEIFSETARELQDAYHNGHIPSTVDLDTVIEVLDKIAERIVATN